MADSAYIYVLVTIGAYLFLCNRAMLGEDVIAAATAEPAGDITAASATAPAPAQGKDLAAAAAAATVAAAEEDDDFEKAKQEVSCRRCS